MPKKACLCFLSGWKDKYTQSHLALLLEVEGLMDFLSGIALTNDLPELHLSVSRIIHLIHHTQLRS
jgi:hypothetical protein